MSQILALETATEAFSVALLVSGEVREVFDIAPREHAARVLPTVDELLAEAGLTLKQLDAVAVGQGPGSFTGVRIGISIAQGLALGANLPMVPVSSLRAMAGAVHRCDGAEQVAAVLDARMDQVYAGAFRWLDGTMQPAGPEQVCDAAYLKLGAGPWHFAGPGVAAYRDTLEARFAAVASEWTPERYPRAQDVAELASTMLHQAVAPEDVLPTYLRNAV